MRKIILIFVLIFIFVGFSAFEVHKFYVSIYQINFNQKEKRLEIISRIFIDDLNEVLLEKYSKKTNFSDANIANDDVELMKKYLSENFLIKVNGISKPINYLSNEIETNVLICYFNIKNISKIKKLEIKNKALFELNSEQQNIMQTTIYGKKKSLLLTLDNAKETIKIE